MNTKNKNNESVQLFRSITADYKIIQSQIIKFFKWGNNDIQQALNYYYRKIEKQNKFQQKNKKNENSFNDNKQLSLLKYTKKKQEIKEENNKEKYKQQQQKQDINKQKNNSPKQFPLFQQQISQLTIFDRMKKASIKQKKTEQFISKVRKQYQLPIGNSKNSIKNKNSSSFSQKQNKIQQEQEQNQNYDVEDQFKDADYLPKVFSNKLDIDNNKLQLQQQEVNSQSENQYEDIMEDQDQIRQELKGKVKEILIQTQHVGKVNKTKSSTITQTKLSKTFSFQSKVPKSNLKNDIKTQKNNKNSMNDPTQKPSIGMRTRNNSKNKPQPKFQMYQSFEQQQKEQIIKPSQVIKQKKLFIQSEKTQKIQKIQIPNQIYLGSYIFQGFKTDTKPFPENFLQGCAVQYKYYIQPQKKKKNANTKSSKSTQKYINMRISFNDIQICRVQDHQARIFVPLITQNIIRLQIILYQLPYIINTFSKVKFNTQIYLKKKAITEPVVETFDGQSEELVNLYKGIREELAGLFQRLCLNVVTLPLIKNKSKFTKNFGNINQKIKKQQQKAIEYEKKKLQFKKKQEQFNIRKQTDPFFKIKQTNLTEMLKKPTQLTCQTTSTPLKPKPFSLPSYQSQIKKKVIQLSFIQQNKYSQLIDLYQQDIKPIYPKINFKSQLYHYQAVALAWMLKRQGKRDIQNVQIKEEKDQIHPLWTEYQLPIDENKSNQEIDFDNNSTIDIKQNKNKFRSIFYNELTAQTSVIKPVTKIKFKGGILADQMGLGKTVMMAALISSKIQKTIKKNQAQNLVVVPLTLLSQWQSQIKKHTKNCSVICYYANDRHKFIQQLPKYTVVITTYGTLSYQFTKMTKINKIGLYKYKWKRIILDQAHYIKGRIIQTSKAAYNLQGECRWCLTGTPIQNGLNDLFSLIHFIKYSPWSEFQCWSKYIIKPHQNNDENVYQVLRTLLKRVFLRRTKNSKDNQGKNIIQLPKKQSKIQILQMSPQQRQFYDMVYESTKAKIDQLDKLGIITAKYMQVLQILMKLRQVCCHPVLFKSITKFVRNPQSFEAELRKFIRKRQSVHKQIDQQNQNYFQPIIQGEQQIRVQINQQNQKVSQNFLKQTVQKIVRQQQLDNCLICLDNVQDPVITSCLHIFCKTCMIRQIQQFGSCASCRKSIKKQDFMHLPRQNRFNVNLQSEQFQRSTKMIALMQHLKKMNPYDKAVVFSQFLGMLDLLEHDFKKNNLKFVRMQGSTPQKQRAKMINSFSNNPQIKIFLVSLKTAGVGLNLVAANKVFLMDPWWNPGVQEQAIQRVHRIGQKKQVQVIRFIMDKSIQMRMVELNNQKKNLSQMVLSFKQNQNQSKFDKLRYLLEKY